MSEDEHCAFDRKISKERCAGVVWVNDKWKLCWSASNASAVQAAIANASFSVFAFSFVGTKLANMLRTDSAIPVPALSASTCVAAARVLAFSHQVTIM